MSDHSIIEWESPGWPAPKIIQAVTTQRFFRHLGDECAELNFARHADNNSSRLAENSSILIEHFNLPGNPVWLHQKHTADIVKINSQSRSPVADGSYTTDLRTVCAVLSADCAPVFMTDLQGKFVGIVHAGWRGVASGIIESAVSKVPAKPEDIIAWVGPCIGKRVFEVGLEVKSKIISNRESDEKFFTKSNQKYYMDLTGIILARLLSANVYYVGSSNSCTYSDSSKWFSYRREMNCGRMASLIWFQR